MPYCPDCGASTQATATFCAACGVNLRASSSEVTLPERPTDDLETLRRQLASALAPQYEVLRLLGIGGMGAVFLAREPALKRLVAVKTLFPHLAADESFRARFAREGRAAAALSHPNVVPVYTVGEMVDPPMPYIIMQYVEGPTLASWIKDRADEGKTVGEREARRIVGEVAGALAAAHARGLVHRDIKPGNVLMETESGRAFVADFGLTAALDVSEEDARAAASEQGAILGTPAYMSPEQAVGGPVGPPTDLYSLGMLAYELVVGTPPFSPSNTAGWISAHLNEQAPPLRHGRPDLSPEFTRLVDRCLGKAPQERPSARDVQSGLLPTLETEIVWPPPGMRAFRRVARLLVVLSVGTIVSGLIIVAALARPPSVLRIEEDWWEHFGTAGAGSSLGVRAESESSSPTVTIEGWQLTLLVAAGVFGISTLALFVVLARAGLDGIGHHRLGWKWTTVWDAAADPDGRSGLLVAGAREFASLVPTQRENILLARRATLATLLFAGCWIALSVGIWSVLVALGFVALDGAGAVIGTGVALLITVPVGLAGAASASSAIREWQLLRPMPRRRTHTGTIVAAPGGPRDVIDWYKPGGVAPVADPDVTVPSTVEAPVTEELSVTDLEALQATEEAAAPQPETQAAPITPAGRPARKRQLASGIGAIAAVIVWLALAMGVTGIVASVFTSAHTVLQIGPDTRELASLLRRPAEQTPLHAAMEAADSYLPALNAVDGGVVRGWIHALIGDDRAPNALVTSAGPPITVGGNPASTSALVTTAAKGLSADSARLFAELDRHPRTALYRRIARADRADIFAAVLDRPLTEYPSLADLPDIPYLDLRKAVQANAHAGVAAIARQDFTGAASRFGENAAFVRHLLQVPHHFAPTFAIGMLQHLALSPLAELENLRGRVQQAGSLSEAARQIAVYGEAQYWQTRMAGLAANPRNLTSYIHALRTEHVPPGFRIDGLVAAWDGFCANPREILSGVSPSRSAAAFAAADSMRDVPGARVLAELSERAWISTTANRLGTAASELQLSKRDMRSVWRRLTMCRLKLNSR